MAERLIPVNKKQYEQIVTLRLAEDRTAAAAVAAARDLQVYAQPFVDGLDEALPPSTILGARCVDGVYSLVLEVPDIAPKADPVLAPDIPAEPPAA